MRYTDVLADEADIVQHFGNHFNHDGFAQVLQAAIRCHQQVIAT